MFISTSVPLNEVKDSVISTIHDINPRQSIRSISTLELLKEEALSSDNIVGQLVTLFAVLAFSIALTGVVGVVAYNVSQRRKEIGIRVALGANPKRIRNLFALQGMSLCVVGIGIGALIMAFLSPALTTMLFETDALNIPVYIVTGAFVAIFAALAILVPVRQATAIQPNQALREQ